MLRDILPLLLNIRYPDPKEVDPSKIAEQTKRLRGLIAEEQKITPRQKILIENLLAPVDLYKKSSAMCHSKWRERISIV